MATESRAELTQQLLDFERSGRDRRQLAAELSAREFTAGEIALLLAILERGRDENERHWSVFCGSQRELARYAEQNVSTVSRATRRLAEDELLRYEPGQWIVSWRRVLARPAQTDPLVRAVESDFDRDDGEKIAAPPPDGVCALPGVADCCPVLPARQSAKERKSYQPPEPKAPKRQSTKAPKEAPSDQPSSSASAAERAATSEALVDLETKRRQAKQEAPGPSKTIGEVLLERIAAPERVDQLRERAIRRLVQHTLNVLRECETRHGTRVEDLVDADRVEWLCGVVVDRDREEGSLEASNELMRVVAYVRRQKTFSASPGAALFGCAKRRGWLAS